jgi:hypothetical protein
MNAEIYKTAWNALGKCVYTFEVISPLLLLNYIFKEWNTYISPSLGSFSPVPPGSS